MKKDKNKIKIEMIETAIKLKRLGYMPGFSGNISFKLSDDEIFITPSFVDKSQIKKEDICIIDINGKFIKGKPSSEYKMHLFIYRNRKEINNVIHSHPPNISAISCLKIKKLPALLSEFFIMLGSLPKAKYAIPSTKEVGKSLFPFINKTNSIIISNHGLVCYSNDLSLSLSLTEEAEHYADIYFKTYGKKTSLIGNREIKKLAKLRVI